MTPDQLRPVVSDHAAEIHPETGVDEFEESSTPELSVTTQAELLEPQAWAGILLTYAKTMNVAVALTDTDGRQLGLCQNGQPVWLLAHVGKSDQDLCSFCLGADLHCSAVKSAISTGELTLTHDVAGLAHVAAPLWFANKPVGALIAGQVFDHFPEPLPLRRLARDCGLPAQQLWELAVKQQPISDRKLLIYGELLKALGGAFLRERYAVFLGRKLKDSAKSLRESKEAADHANRAKSTFLATMSHEIRTPMNAILGMAELLAETQLTSEQARFVDVFQRNGANLLALINDILDLSKIESGNFVLESTPFDLRDVIDRTMELVRPKALSKGITFTENIAPEVSTDLRGDPTRLQQVLLNLLGNSVKFTKQGFVKLSVEPCVPARQGCIEFKVSDSGIGIPADKLATIFDAFTQADSSTTREYGGTGLGLGIARHLIELMGGGLSVESAVDQGTIFRFTLRLEASEMVNMGPTALDDLRGQRALIIDYDPPSRLIFQHALQSWGVDVAGCASGQEAISLLAGAKKTSAPFSLVLLDAGLPGFDSLRVASELRRIAPDLAFLILTSEIPPLEAAKFREIGISHWAIKPVARKELRRVLGEVMQTNKAGSAPEPAGVSIASATSNANDPGLRILIADDSEDNCFLVEAYLADSKYQLTFVNDGDKAVLSFQQNLFDLVLMDVQMPVLDGLSATRLIREWETKEHRTATPILALTADALPSDIEASAHAGCTAHLSKPLSKLKLLSAISQFGRVLERR
jgi:two-component system sensor histidine kinase/response regulator